MDQPSGFLSPVTPPLFVSFVSLYGLKQSPRAWFGRFSSAVLEFGMTHCEVDHSVIFLHSKSGLCFYLVYVDDIVITGDDSTGILHLKSHLHRQF